MHCTFLILQLGLWGRIIYYIKEIFLWLCCVVTKTLAFLILIHALIELSSH